VPQAPVAPVPPVDVIVTVKEVVPAGVDDVVATVSVEDVLALVIVGLKLVVTPVGALGVQFTVTIGVHAAVPVQV